MSRRAVSPTCASSGSAPARACPRGNLSSRKRGRGPALSIRRVMIVFDDPGSRATGSLSVGFPPPFRWMSRWTTRPFFRRIVRKRTVAFRRPSPRETTSRRPHPVHPILPGGPIRASRRARNGVVPDTRRHPGGQGGRVDCEGSAVAGERFDGPRRGRPSMNDLSTMHTVPPGSVVHVPRAVAESTPVQPPCPAHRVYAPRAVAGVGAGRVAMLRGYTRSAGSPGPFDRKPRPRLITADGAAGGQR